jgi:hypothetical protein
MEHTKGEALAPFSFDAGIPRPAAVEDRHRSTAERPARTAPWHPIRVAPFNR